MQQPENANANLTQDGFPSEKEAEGFLESLLLRSGCFQVFRQHRGVLLSRKHKQDSIGELRCDLLLIPSDPAIQTGAIVVEIKKSGVRIGPALSQLLDYLHCSFQLRNGIHVIPTYGFLFPCHEQHQAVASIMSQQNLGSCSLTRRGIRFASGEETLLEFDLDGQLERSRMSQCGRRVGSR